MTFVYQENFDPAQDIEAELTAIRKTAPAKHSASSSDQGILTVDVYQTDDDIVVKSTVAGVGSDDIDISVTNDTVTIKGVRKLDEKTKPADYYHQELYWGPFARSIILPEDVDADGAKATLKNGLLTLRLPKLAKLRTRKVRISS